VRWQRDVVDALRELSPSTLFIVATHSEEILDAVLSYERFILVEDRDPRAQLSGDASEDEAGALS
jgi:predicted ATP-binding protein involved in virulence